MIKFTNKNRMQMIFTCTTIIITIYQEYTKKPKLSFFVLLIYNYIKKILS